MDREDSLRAFSEQSKKKVCIHCSHKRHLSDFCILSLTSPKPGNRQQKKSSRKTIMQPQRSRGSDVHLEQEVKGNTQEIPVSTKRTGGRRSQRSHPVSQQGGAAVEFAGNQETAPCLVKIVPTAGKQEPPLFAQLQTTPPFQIVSLRKQSSSMAHLFSQEPC